MSILLEITEILTKNPNGLTIPEIKMKTSLNENSIRTAIRRNLDKTIRELPFKRKGSRVLALMGENDEDEDFKLLLNELHKIMVEYMDFQVNPPPKAIEMITKIEALLK